MNLILKYLVRTIRQKKIRTSIIVLSLTLASAMLFININARSITQDSYSKNIRKSAGKVDIIVTKKAAANDTLFEKEDVELKDVKVNHAIGALNTFAVYKDENGKKYRVNLFGAEKDQLVETNLISFSNKYNLSSLKGNKIIISSVQSKKYGISIGDTIDLAVQGKVFPFKVAALTDSTGFFAAENSSIYMMIPLETMNKVIGTEDKLSSLYIDIPGSYDIDKALKEIGVNESFDVSEIFDRDEFNLLMRSITMILVFALLLTMFISTVVILSLYKHVLDERLPVIGTFRSVGVNRAKTSLILTLENCIYGVLGGTLGILLGYLLLNTFLTTLIDSLHNGLKINSTPSVLSFLLTIVFSVGWAVFISIISIVKVNKMSLKDSIFQTVQTVQKFKLSEVIMGLLLLISGAALLWGGIFETNLMLETTATLAVVLGFILLTQMVLRLFSTTISRLTIGVSSIFSHSVKNLRNNKIVSRNVKIFVIVLGVSISIFSVMKSIDDFFTYATKSFKFDVIVGVDPSVKKDYGKISDLEGVKSTYQLHDAMGEIKVKNSVSSLEIVGRESDDRFDEFIKGAMKINGYKLSQLNENEIILDQNMLEKLNLKIGNIVEVLFNGKKHNFKVAASMDSSRFSSTRNASIILMDRFKKDFSNIPETIYVKSSKGSTEQKRIIEDYLLDTMSTVQTNKEFFTAQKSNNEALLLIVQTALLFGLVVGALGIINNLIISYTTRKKEFAILYSTAMSKRQLKLSIVYEIILVAVVVVIMAFVFSLLLIITLAKILDSVDVILQFSYPWVEAFFILGGGFIGLLLSAVFPFNIISRLNVFQELRSE